MTNLKNIYTYIITKRELSQYEQNYIELMSSYYLFLQILNNVLSDFWSYKIIILQIKMKYNFKKYS